MRFPSLTWTRSLLLVAAVLVGALLVPKAPPAHADSCITTLPVSYNVPSKYAAAYTNTLTVYVHTQGPLITGLTASLSTFHGDVLGTGKLHYSLGGKGGTLKIHLKYAMQAGRYTLYFQGYPNRNPSCGPKHSSRVLQLTTCSSGGLPVKLLDLTDGTAADFGSSYDFAVQSTSGQVLKGLNATLTAPSGRVIGHKAIPVLFGRINVSIPLSQSISAGTYELDVAGSQPGRPAACGVSDESATLRFN